METRVLLRNLHTKHERLEERHAKVEQAMKRQWRRLWQAGTNLEAFRGGLDVRR